MSTKLRWGVLGYARIAQNAFIPALLKSGNGLFHAVASRDPQKREECRKRFNPTKIFASYEELMNDPNIHAIYIPLPNGLHKEWVIRGAEQGKHILCEKPLALNGVECREMAEACRQNGVRLTEAFMYRYSPKLRKVREILAGGELGEIKAVHASFSFLLDREDDYRWDPAQGGGALYDVGCYPVNFIGMVTGAEPVSMSVEYEEHRGVDRALSAVLKYESGIIATLQCGMNAHFQNDATIVGTRGVLKVPQPFLGKTGTMTLTTGGGSQTVRAGWVDPYQREIEDFGEVVLSGKPPLFPLEETLRNMQVIDGMLAKIK